MRGRFGDGGRSAGTWRKSSMAARRATLTAGGGSDRLCCTGRMTAATSDVGSPIRIGISACLLGEEVRFDGGHKRVPFLTDVFSRFVEWVPVCPEVEAGFGTPREAMHLARVDGSVRLITLKTARDLTAPMENLIARRLPALDTKDLSGYILKKNSPSCGLERVKVYSSNGVPSATGRGLFAAALIARFPLLPVEEEGRLA